MRGVISTSIPGEWAGVASSRGRDPLPAFNHAPLSLLYEIMPSGIPQRGDTLKTRAGDHAGHPSRVPGPAAAARPPPCSSRVMTRPAPPRPGRRRLTSGHWPGAAAARLSPFIASLPAPRDSRTAGDSRRVLNDRKDQTMAQTLPISAEQPLDATRTAAGQVVTLAGAQAVAVQAAASITLAALLWPLIPAAHAVAGLASALGKAAATPAPGTAGRGNARIGRCRTGRDGARRPAGGGARGRRDHAGGRGGVRAPGPVHRRHRAGRPRAGADARRGAGDPAGADAVPGGDRNQGVHQPGRGRPRADPAAAAGRGRRGICWAAGWWPPGSRRTARPGWPP